MYVRQVSRPSLRRSASIRPSCSSAIIAARTLKSSRSSKAAIPISVLSSGDQLVSRCSKTLSSTEGWSVTTAQTVSVRHRRLAVPRHQPVGRSPAPLTLQPAPDVFEQHVPIPSDRLASWWSSAARSALDRLEGIPRLVEQPSRLALSDQPVYPAPTQRGADLRAPMRGAVECCPSARSQGRRCAVRLRFGRLVLVPSSPLEP